jgi:carbonic anhydrase
MAKANNDFQLIDLTMRFDTGEYRRNPDRFRRDPASPDLARPDPNFCAPERPIQDAGVIADLFRRGNLNYAGFIYDCKTAAGKRTRALPEPLPSGGHYLFLNEREVARDGSGAGTEEQDPYAAVLSCIDSRVPVELVLGQAADDIFAIRSAGNILTELGEASASMHYILSNYSQGAQGGRKTVRVILVLGHTRCGAIKAAHAAFRPGGPGTVGLPPSLAGLLYQIKPAVDHVLGCKDKCGLKGDEEIEGAISAVNAYFSHLQIQQMAIDTGTGSNLTVFYGVYDVDDFLLEFTNIPGYPNQQGRDTAAGRKRTRTYSWAANAPVVETDELDAITQDAARFAKRKRIL